MSFKRINVQEARELIKNSDALVVDVRDAASYQAGHIPDAETVDETNVGEFIQSADLARPLIVCCYHGNMSQGAAEYFNRNGFENTYSLDGGFEEWQSNSISSAPESMTSCEFSNLPTSARIWIYGAEKPLTPDHVQVVESHMAAFMNDWQSHGRPVTPSWKLFHDRFLVIGADEEAFSLSGCSIDSMVHTLEVLKRQYGLRFTNSGGKIFYRNSEGTIECVERFAFGNLVKRGLINDKTVVFDSTIATVGNFLEGQWEKPMRESWHMDAFGTSLTQS